MKKEKKKKNEVYDDGEKTEEVEEEEGNKKEVEEDKGKQKEVEEEEGKNKEVVEEEEEQINEVDEDKGKQKEVEEEEQEKNEVEDDGIKTINAHTFPGICSLMLLYIEAFNNYPWGHESFELTVKYLLKPLGPKTNNLFGFPWAFMAWAFKVIRHLTYQVNAEEEISSLRILRWVVHPWLVPTEKELQMPYLITLGLVETLFDPVVDGRGIDAGAGQDQGATSCRRCSGFLCEKCKKQDEDSIMYLQTLSQAAKRRKKSFIKAIQNLKKKIFGELPMTVREEVVEFKHVNVYKRVTIAEKNKLVDLARANDLRAEYVMHCFRGEDFRIMTSMDIWWEDWYVDEILSLMRERHVRYPEYYDFTDRILDLNFYFNFKLRYDEMSEEATTVGGRSFT
ncbi:hypothetical protein KY284_030392 [Solanum tuberosum]|nr:hypothetical protein KY284_030392 [Solanum tuberosum]